MRKSIFLPKLFLTTAYCIFIFYMLIRSQPISTPDVPQFDKVLHAGSYFVMALLLMWTFSSSDFSKKAVLYITIIIAFCHGIVGETMHYFLPYRDWEIMDMASNIFGGFAGAMTFLYFKKFMMRRRLQRAC